MDKIFSLGESIRRWNEPHEMLWFVQESKSVFSTEGEYLEVKAIKAGLALISVLKARANGA